MKRMIFSAVDSRTLSIFLALAIALAVGCAKNAPAPEPVPVPDSEFSQGPAPAPAPTKRLSPSDVRLPPVYFDLDSSRIRSEFQAGLEAGARALKESGGSVVIAGHCDERGSEEYNMALGERRADSVRKYLYNLGVPTSKMSIVSYGEAQPAVSGRGESAWRLNRRAEFSVR